MSRKQAIALVFVLGSLVCMLGLALLSQRLTTGYRTPLTECMIDEGTGGGLGLALWARRMGVQVQPLQDPLWEAPKSCAGPPAIAW